LYRSGNPLPSSGGIGRGTPLSITPHRVSEWKTGAIAGLAATCNAMRPRPWAVALGQGRSLPGGDGRPRPASRGAHLLRSRRCAIPPGVDTHGVGLGGRSRGRYSQGAVLVGGVPGVRYNVTFCPGGGAETAPRRPAPQRRSSTLAGSDHRCVVPSGLNEPQFLPRSARSP